MLIRLLSGGIVDTSVVKAIGYDHDKQCVFFVVSKRVHELIKMGEERHTYDVELGYRLIDEIWLALRSNMGTFDVRLWLEQNATPKDDVKLAV